ncbi:MAG: hypothetical protein NW201_08740 [Gemmatimonadales bacterium]|nr:hypothetical protein [Gemmatimonadales bacterium]
MRRIVAVALSLALSLALWLGLAAPALQACERGGHGAVALPAAEDASAHAHHHAPDDAPAPEHPAECPRCDLAPCGTSAGATLAAEHVTRAALLPVRVAAAPLGAALRLPADHPRTPPTPPPIAPLA